MVSRCWSDRWSTTAAPSIARTAAPARCNDGGGDPEIERSLCRSRSLRGRRGRLSGADRDRTDAGACSSCAAIARAASSAACAASAAARVARTAVSHRRGGGYASASVAVSAAAASSRIRSSSTSPADRKLSLSRGVGDLLEGDRGTGLSGAGGMTTCSVGSPSGGGGGAGGGGSTPPTGLASGGGGWRWSIGHRGLCSSAPARLCGEYRKQRVLRTLLCGKATSAGGASSLSRVWRLRLSRLRPRHAARISVRAAARLPHGLVTLVEVLGARRMP